MCLNENLQGTKRQTVAYRFQFKPPSTTTTHSLSNQTGSFKHFVSLLSAAARKRKSKWKKKKKKIIRQGKNIPWRNKLISLIFSVFFSFPSLSMVIFFVRVIKY